LKRGIYHPLAVLVLGAYLGFSLIFPDGFSHPPKALGGSEAKSWTVRPKDHLDEAIVDQVQQDETGQKIELERYFNKNLIDKRLASDRTNYNQMDPSVVADGDGNIYIAFTMDPGKIMMQKLNSSGEVQWEQDKQVFVSGCVAAGGQHGNHLATALHPNGIVVVANCYVGVSQNDIWAQLVNTSGVTQWAAETRVHDNTVNNKFNQEVQVLGSDIYVAWADDRTVANTYEMYAQKLDSSGNRTIAGDQALVTPGVNLLGPRLKKNSSGKLLLSYINSSNNQIWVRQYNSSFTQDWGPNAAGTTTSPGSKSAFATTVIGDNSYYFFRKWSTSPPNYQIYGQSLNSAGGTRWNGGLDLRVGRRVVPGAILAWNDGTNPYFGATEFSGATYPCGKKVDAATGAVLWGGIFDNEPQLIVSSYVPPHQPAVNIVFSGSVNHVVYSNLNGAYQADVYYNSFNTSGTITHASDIMINRDFGVLDQQQMAIAKDSNGDIAGAWRDSRVGVYSYDVYVQKFNSSGTSQWTDDTKANSTTTGCSSIETLAIGTDFYIVWSSVGNVYLNKINSSGVRQWADLRVNVGAASQTSNPSLSYDGTNIIVAWEDNRGGAGNLQIYFNAVSTAGVVQLGSDVRVTVESATKKLGPEIRSDGTNTFVVWEDSRNGSSEDIYMQKINGSGVPQYAGDVKIDNMSGIYASSNNPNFVVDSGSIYVVWEDDRNPGDLYSDIYMAGFNGQTRLFDDVLVNDDSTGDKVDSVIGFSSGALYIAWKDKRDSSTYTDIYMAKFNTNGIKRYANDAQVNINNTTVIHANPTMTLNDSFVGWDDDRNGVTNKDIYLAKGIDKVKSNGKIHGDGLVLDAQTQNVRYGTLSWTADKPANTEVKFRTRSADTEAGLSGAAWSDYYLALSAAKIFGTGIAKATADIESDDKRYLEVEVSLVTSDLISSPAVEDFTVSYLTNEAPEINSIVIGSTSGGSVEFYYSVVDPDNSTALVSFEYWDGSAWKSSTNASGIGALSTNQTVKGVWSAGTDLPNTQITSKIRLTADDSAPFNNIGTGTSPEFMLDTTETSASATPSASGTPGPRVSPTVSSTATISASPTITPGGGDDEEEPPVIKEIKDVVKELSDIIIMGMQTPGGQAAAVAVAVLLSAPVLFSSINFISRLLSLFRLTIRFGGAAIAVKKRRGYVFDNVSKRPIPLALIKIFDYETSSLVYQTYTNTQGEFVLKLGSRKYSLDVYKTGYTVLEVKDEGKEFNSLRTDGYYDHIYYSGEIINAQNEVVDLSIPMNPVEKPGIWAVILRGSLGFLRRTSYLFLVVGTAFAILFFALAPNIPVNIAILIYYLLIWSVLAYLVFTHPKRAGDVLDLGKVKLPQALVRIFDQNNRLIQTAVSDNEGEFILNISKGSYQVEARKAGFKPKKDILEVKTLRDVGRKEIRLERP